MKYEHLNFIKIMKTQPRQHISNKYNTCTIVISPVYSGSKHVYMYGKTVGYKVYP